jgi:hypothetical protein
MPDAKVRTFVWAPARLQGALREQALPEPPGDAYRRVGDAASAGGGATPANSSAPAAVAARTAALRQEEMVMALLRERG